MPAIQWLRNKPNVLCIDVRHEAVQAPPSSLTYQLVLARSSTPVNPISRNNARCTSHGLQVDYLGAMPNNVFWAAQCVPDWHKQADTTARRTDPTS